MLSIRALILALATATTSVSAINIHLFPQLSCSGGSFWCDNWNPDTCCGVESDRYFSLRWTAVPPDWKITCRAHTGPYCATLERTGFPLRGNGACLTGGFWSGAGYGFDNNDKKRGIDFDATEPEQQECLRPNKYTSEDGREYDLGHLDSRSFNELHDLAANATLAGDLPERVHQFMMARK